MVLNPNDQAFNDVHYLSNGDHVHDPNYHNLTKREYFAAMAMQGLRASRLSDAITDTEAGRKLWGSLTIAKQAISDADALIAELSK